MLALVRMFITIHTIHIWPCDPCVPLPWPWRWWGVGWGEVTYVQSLPVWNHPLPTPSSSTAPQSSTPSERTGCKWKMCSNNLWIQHIWYTNNHCNFWIKRLSLFLFFCFSFYIPLLLQQLYRGMIFCFYVRACHVLKRNASLSFKVQL